jgi:histidinol-phosphate aminotransferase
MTDVSTSAPLEISERVKQVLRRDVIAMSAYHVADARGMIKLDAMENPYALPVELQAEIGRIAAQAPLNRYPDPAAAQLIEALRVSMAVPAGIELMLGNGSDELIQLLVLAAAKPGATVLGVEPSFAMYPLVARSCGVRFAGVPLRSDFGLDLPRLLAAVERERPSVIFLAYPNNPTGNLFATADVDAVIRHTSGVVVIDEAYHPFARATFMPQLGQYPNLLLLRTLSKLGLAGLRLGVLAGRLEWIRELDKLRLPYNVNVLTQRIAQYMLSQERVLQEQARLIRHERGRLFDRLRALPGVTAYTSDANFILFRVAAAARVFEGLRARGVLIKKLAGSHPALAECLRVTVGTPTENEAFLEALNQELSPLAP